MSALKGKDLESLLMFRGQKFEEQRKLTLSRYGVSAVMMNDEQGIPRWQVIPSLPDFEGVIFGTGQQFILEAKVCSQASYPIHQAGKKTPKQFAHMLKRAEFGAKAYLILHFNGRDLKTKSEPAITFAIKVHPNLPLWREFESAERISLSRADAELYGYEVPWNLYSDRASKLTPDLSFLLK